MSPAKKAKKGKSLGASKKLGGVKPLKTDPIAALNTGSQSTGTGAGKVTFNPF